MTAKRKALLQLSLLSIFCMMIGSWIGMQYPKRESGSFIISHKLALTKGDTIRWNETRIWPTGADGTNTPGFCVIPRGARTVITDILTIEDDANQGGGTLHILKITILANETSGSNSCDEGRVLILDIVLLGLLSATKQCVIERKQSPSEQTPFAFLAFRLKSYAA